jgi:hypothetical protein
MRICFIAFSFSVSFLGEIRVETKKGEGTEFITQLSIA